MIHKFLSVFSALSFTALLFSCGAESTTPTPAASPNLNETAKTQTVQVPASEETMDTITSELPKGEKLTERRDSSSAKTSVSAKAEVAKEKKNQTSSTTASTDKKRKKRSSKRKSGKKAGISFQQTTHPYGTIQQGDKVEHQFKFTNTGKAPLTITQVKASCGCTQPSYPFMPIEPGEQGYIGVVFDSKGKLGKQRPTITVVTNASPSTYKLYLEGFVDANKTDGPADAATQTSSKEQ